MTAAAVANDRTVWWARLAHDSGEHSLIGVNSDRCPEGVTVGIPAAEARGRRPAGWRVELRYRPADRSVVHIEVSDAVAVLRQPLWFAELAHATSPIPSASLLAFAGLAAPPGCLVSPGEVLARRVRMQDRIGELRWWTRSGVVDTVEIDDQYLGQGLGRVLTVAAEAVGRLRDWAPLRPAA